MKEQCPDCDSENIAIEDKHKSFVRPGVFDTITYYKCLECGENFAEKAN